LLRTTSRETPSADATEHRHEQDPGSREILVVIGTSREERAVERVRRCGDEIDPREVAGELPIAE
jgi:hypothetical protein